MSRAKLDDVLWEVIRELSEDYALLPLAPNREIVEALEQGDYSRPLRYPRVTRELLGSSSRYLFFTSRINTNTRGVP